MRLLMIGIFLFLIVGVVSGDSLSGREFNIVIDEPNDRAEEAVIWPITVGVPFAKGAINYETPVAVFDKENPVPVQTKILGKWETGTKSPKWMLLDFQGQFGKSVKPSWKVRTNEKPASGKSVQIRHTKDQIIVDTGTVSFAVSKNNFSLFDTFSDANGKKYIDKSSIYWVRDNGQRYEVRSYGKSEVKVETHGPMRAVIKAKGWYAPVDANSGEPMMRYQVRIAAFAGLPYVRVYHTLIWTQDDKVAMKEFGLSFNLAQSAAQAEIGIENAETISGETGIIEAFQGKNASGKLTINGQSQAIKRFSGWVSAQNKNNGLAIALRDMAMQIPKAFTITPKEISVQLWAPQAGMMSMKEEDRVLPSHVGRYNKEWDQFNKVVNPQGVAKTHEIWIWPVTPKVPPAKMVNDYIQRPVVAMADPAYQCKTDAIPYLRAKAATPAKYGYVEEALDALFQHVVYPHDYLGDYAMWNFGDVHLFGEAPWRTWDCGGYNWPAIPWMMFYRSGGRHYYEAGMRNARHVMDVDVCHHGVKHGPAYTKVLGYTYIYSPLHWAWGPMFAHFTTHPQFLMYCYYMTGDERAGDVLNLMAASAKENTSAPTLENWLKNKTHLTRSQYGGIVPQMVYYQFTGDQGFLTCGKNWCDVSVAARNPDGRFQNNTFMGFFYTGLSEAYRFTRDGNIKKGLIGLVKDFVKKPLDAVTAPNWGRESLLPFAFAYERTKDVNYLRYPIWRICNQSLLTQRQPDLPIQFNGGFGYSATARLYSPVIIEGSLSCLGAWADANFVELPAWPRNNAYFGSIVAKKDNFNSSTTIYLKKEAKKAGRLLLTFKKDNITQPEKYEGKKLEVQITDPNGKERIIALEGQWNEFDGIRSCIGPAPQLIEFAADEPSGQYKVEILAEQQVFWINPQSDLVGMVVYQPQAKVRFSFHFDPGKIYFHLKNGVEKITVTKIGSNNYLEVLPIRVFGPADEFLGMITVPGSQSLEIAVAANLRDKNLYIFKEMSGQSARNTDLDGLAIDGAEEYFAVEANKWFLPVREK